MKRFHDVSVLLQPHMPTYPGEPGPHLRPILEVAKGDPANVAVLSLGTHTGTHVDAPVHFFPGAPSVEALPLAVLVGPVQVMAMEEVRDEITADTLEATGLPEGTERLLLKTHNSRLWERPNLQTDFVGLSPDAAQWLVDRGIRLVGIDYLSIERYDGTGDTHRALLGAGIVVIEGLDLRAVRPGEYTLICLPLRLQGADGSPVRAILLE